MVDFRSTSSSRRPRIDSRIEFENVVLARCTMGSEEGFRIGARQFTVAIHEGAPFRMMWRLPGSDRVQSSTIFKGRAHLVGARLPFWQCCEGLPSFFAFAIGEAFLRRISEDAFDQIGDCAIRPSIGLNDPVIARLGALGREEMLSGGLGGPLYVESLGAVLAVHLLRRYGPSTSGLGERKGGIGARRLRRVLDYINEHLNGELGLITLAELAALSPQHFGNAFKIATGTSPHRYVIERRVARARELLSDKDRPIAEIAQAVGFSSQSHLTANFRRVTGMTPRRFRDALD